MRVYWFPICLALTKLKWLPLFWENLLLLLHFYYWECSQNCMKWAWIQVNFLFSLNNVSVHNTNLLMVLNHYCRSLLKCWMLFRTVIRKVQSSNYPEVIFELISLTSAYSGKQRTEWLLCRTLETVTIYKKACTYFEYYFFLPFASWSKCTRFLHTL